MQPAAAGASPATSAQRVRVPEALAGARLDRALVALFPEHSRERLQALIAGGRVRSAGAPLVRAALCVHAGQALEVELAEPAPSRSANPAGREVRVLWHDEHLIAVDKPAGVAAHASHTMRGGSVAEQMAARFGALPTPQEEDGPGIVHRLDAETSGVMLLARSAAAGAALVDLFRARSVRKTYLAIVHGESRFDSDWIELAIGRAKPGSDRLGVVAPDAPVAKDASTLYRTLERFRWARGGAAALLELEPRTGRRHQLRVHLEAVGMPIVGDKLYRGRRGGGAHARSFAHFPPGVPAVERHMLHALRIELEHPVSREPLAFECAPPADFQALLAFLRGAAAAAGPADSTGPADPVG
jgi:23S rRNA pseudouridine1911/1915/1917 synthase